MHSRGPCTQHPAHVPSCWSGWGRWSCRCGTARQGRKGRWALLKGGYAEQDGACRRLEPAREGRQVGRRACVRACVRALTRAPHGSRRALSRRTRSHLELGVPPLPAQPVCHARLTTPLLLWCARAWVWVCARVRSEERAGRRAQGACGPPCTHHVGERIKLLLLQLSRGVLGGLGLPLCVGVWRGRVVCSPLRKYTRRHTSASTCAQHARSPCLPPPLHPSCCSRCFRAQGRVNGFERKCGRQTGPTQNCLA